MIIFQEIRLNVNGILLKVINSLKFYGILGFVSSNSLFSGNKKIREKIETPVFRTKLICIKKKHYFDDIAMEMAGLRRAFAVDINRPAV